VQDWVSNGYLETPNTLLPSSPPSHVVFADPVHVIDTAQNKGVLSSLGTVGREDGTSPTSNTKMLSRTELSLKSYPASLLTPMKVFMFDFGIYLARAKAFSSFLVLTFSSVLENTSLGTHIPWGHHLDPRIHLLLRPGQGVHVDVVLHVVELQAEVIPGHVQVELVSEYLSNLVNAQNLDQVNLRKGF
jgi:hypothetical protein